MKSLKFEGTGSEYFKIWIVNVLLVIITLGIYHPWAKVRNNRYFYGNITLEGRNFDYHATGKQLFLGYVIGMVLFIIYTVIQQISPIGSLVVLGLLFIAIPWLIWRSLKFSMKMTSFSNVRFSFDGKLKQSYVNFFIYPFLLILTLYVLPGIFAGIAIGAKSHFSENVDVLKGVQIVSIIILVLSLFLSFYIYALMKKKNTSYLLNGSKYGQGIFETNLETKKFMSIGFKVLVLSLILFSIMGAIIYSIDGFTAFKSMQASLKEGHSIKKFLPFIIPMYISMIFVSMFIMAYSLTLQRSYVYANTTLDNKITFESTLRAMPLIWTMISNLFLVMLTLGLAFPWAKVRMINLMVENTLVDTDNGFNTYMTEKQAEESSLGDQIGDAFDIDVGII